MKKSVFLFTITLFFLVSLKSQNKSLKFEFSAEYNCEYAQLDSVKIENLSSGGVKTIYYPDTILELFITNIDYFNSDINQMKLSNNYPNPFSNRTKFDLDVAKPGEFIIEVFDMNGRMLTYDKSFLDKGSHNFSFLGCNQNNYILVVRSDFQIERNIMLRIGNNNQRMYPEIIYNGMSYIKNQQESESSNKDFLFGIGDELQFTGYATKSYGFSDYDIIKSMPTRDHSYLFRINNEPPDKPVHIYGKKVVLKNEQSLVYEVEEVYPWNTYNWEVSDGWEIISGQGTNRIIVNAGQEQGNISVISQNSCGYSEKKSTSVFIGKDDLFYFEIETTEDNTEYSFLISGVDYFEVDWGDGNYDVFYHDGEPKHDYGKAGRWLIAVEGELERFSINTADFYQYVWDCEYSNMLRDVYSPVSNGIKGLVSAYRMFAYTGIKSFSCENFFDEVSSDITIFSYMFEMSDFNSDISNWDVSNGEYFNGMFVNSPFNQDIGNWDLSSALATPNMFRDTPFNQDIGNWNVENVINMYAMFYETPFNQDIGSWDVSNVQRMDYMFFDSCFDQDISKWDVSNVSEFFNFLGGTAQLSVDNYSNLLMKWSFLDLQKNVRFMANNSKYKKGIPSERRDYIMSEFYWHIFDDGNVDEFVRFRLDLEVVPDKRGKVYGARYYNFLDTIEIKAVPSPYYQFVRWESDDIDIEEPELAETLIALPIHDATVTAYFEFVPPEDEEEYFCFAIETSGNRTNYKFLVEDASNLEVQWGDGSSEIVNGSEILSHDYGEPGYWAIKLKGEAKRISFYIGDPYSYAVNYTDMLVDVITPVSNGVSGITSAKLMFSGTMMINQFTALDYFDETSANVTDFSKMFYFSNINMDVSNWDLSNAETTSYMFSFSPFNHDISNWNVSNLKDMSFMFYHNKSFNQPIDNWDVSKVENMQRLFSNSEFNQDVSGWDVGNVTNMSGVFSKAKNFNQDINAWDVSNVEDMSFMFDKNTSFNQPLDNWDVGNVENMLGMFVSSDFNQDISSWNVNNVENMFGMFFNSKFDQDISEWDVSNVKNFGAFLKDSKLSTRNYNKLLIKWSYLDLQNDMIFIGGGSQYDLGLPKQRRDLIINKFNWQIFDGGDTGEYYY